MFSGFFRRPDMDFCMFEKCSDLFRASGREFSTPSFKIKLGKVKIRLRERQGDPKISPDSPNTSQRFVRALENLRISLKRQRNVHILKNMNIFARRQNGHVRGTPDTFKYTKIPGNLKRGFLFALGRRRQQPCSDALAFTTLNREPLEN